MIRMTVCTSSAAAKDYFTKGLSPGAYYFEGQEAPGEWYGKGAERLGLSGEVQQKDFYRLCDNRHPQTGEPLTARTKADRRILMDMTIDEGKHVSVLRELYGDEAIDRVSGEALHKTLATFEADLGARVRAKGADEDRVTGEMVCSVHLHKTARPVGGEPDPHRHYHCLIFNQTYDGKEDKWKAVQYGSLMRDKRYYEATFNAYLSKGLNDLGYVTERNNKYGFDVVGIPQSVIDKFSNRRNLIEAKAAAKGVEDSKGKHAIGYASREQKSAQQSMAELRKIWRQRLTPDESAAMEKVARKEITRGPEITAEQAMRYAVDHTFERVSTISEKRLRAEALRFGVGSVLPDKLELPSEVIGRTVKGERIVTTKAVLDDEIKMLDYARKGVGRHAPIGDVSEAIPDTLSAQQGAAAAHIMQSRDAITGMVGDAGAGKTKTIEALVPGIEHCGKKVFGCAPSANAAQGLREAGIKNAVTLERVLVDEKLQSQMKRQVLFADEAGMISTRDMNRLIDVAKKQQCRLVLVGDYKQHGSVRAGDAMRLLEKEAGVRFARLKTIRRQQVPEYRRAVEMIASGRQPQQGFDALDKMGAIVEASSKERHGLLVKDYVEAVKEGKSALIIAPTHAEGDRLTESLRDALRMEGKIAGKEKSFITRQATNWTEAQKGDPRNYEAGMVVEFYQNAKGGFKRGECGLVTGDGAASVLRQTGRIEDLPKETSRFQVYRPQALGIARGEQIRITQNGFIPTENGGKKRVYNGDIVMAASFTKEGDIRLSDGSILPKTYGHFRRGYVDTSYAAQGKTVDRVFIAAGNESLGATDEKQWYVSVSRGKEACKVYVDSKEDIRQAIARSGERLSAVELVKDRQVEKRLERNRILDYVQRERSIAPSKSGPDRGEAYG